MSIICKESTMDFYGFYTGKIFDAYKYLGAHTEKQVSSMNRLWKMVKHSLVQLW